MKTYGKTDQGLIRSENQDSFALFSPDGVQQIAVVCDGMGGVDGGKIAGKMAVETFLAEMKKLLRDDMTVSQVREVMSYCVAQANRAVYTYMTEHTDLYGMGTTLVAALTLNDAAVVCNVGDSRAYRITKENITQITKDHSMVEEMIERGELTREEARTHPKRNIITRAIGPEETICCDCYTVTLDHGDKLLLCTDGLVVTVQEDDIRKTILSASDAQSAIDRLITHAINNGAPDNVTAVLVENC